MRSILLIIFSLLVFTTQAQSVQWADRVLGFSSEGGRKGFSSKQVLGKPNALPATGISSVAWMPSMSSRLEEEWIKVGFNNPVHVQQIVVAENARPGAISRVILHDDLNRPHEVFSSSAGQSAAQAFGTTKKGGMWKLLVDSTARRITALTLVLDPEDSIAIHQIDAIGIANHQQEITASINVMPGADSISPPVNLGVGVNSFFPEVFPVISPDGNTLFFDRKEHPGNYPGVDQRKNNDDIWYSKKQADGSWSRAKNIGAPLNNGYHNFVCSISPDGNTMLLGNAYMPDGTLRDGISITYKEAAGWTFPEPLQIMNYSNSDPFAEFQLAANGKVILMAIERKDGLGKRDLYASFLIKDIQWSYPVHLGPDVNSAGLEMTPFLASDMVTLYFSSNGISGYGKNDMFISKRLDDSWQRWSEPVNMGPTVNSPEMDAYYTIPASGDYAFFASANKSIGSTDLFAIPLPEDIQPDPVVLVKGRVLESSEDSMDATRQIPVRASIAWLSDSSGQEVGIAGSDPASGNYQIVLPYGEKYQFRAEAEGYFALTESLDLSEVARYREMEVNLLLIPIRKGEVVPIRDVYFEVNRAVLLEESHRELERVRKFLTDNPLVSVEIAGHTNNRCGESFCKQLSERRAKSVARFLLKRGIDEGRISWEGYGSDEPIADNETQEGRQQNQRVEFRITSIDGTQSGKGNSKDRKLEKK